MPPTQRRGGKTASASTRPNQPVLSFGAKSRVTKPSAAPSQPTEKAKALDALTVNISEKDTPKDIAKSKVTEQSQPHVAELAVRQQAKVEIQQPWSEEDKKAIKITKKELQTYWNKEESKSRGPRVHQDDLSLEEKILRHFDLSSQYGPCIGIARLKRWRRADSLNLNPPIEVLSVLLKQEGTTGQRAYIDELLS